MDLKTKGTKKMKGGRNHLGICARFDLLRFYIFFFMERNVYLDGSFSTSKGTILSRHKIRRLIGGDYESCKWGTPEQVREGKI